ncbi:unnamed protein product [Thelazia callipaeda]|uniref:Transmembrane protein n=1 Tax=Thelazia callipaeda TaxID=103827 RepID=A0A0N5CZK9_THECL|nr:unnamed protein product [Thelazia callipaeda]
MASSYPSLKTNSLETSMSGEIFFDFGVKPVKKRTAQDAENRSEKTKPANESSVDDKNEKKKHRRRLDKNVWERTDYAKASSVAKKSRKKLKRRQRTRGKGSCRDKTEKTDSETMEDVISLSRDDSTEEDEQKALRKKRKKRKKKKRSNESNSALETDTSKNASGCFRSDLSAARLPLWKQNSENPHSGEHSNVWLASGPVSAAASPATIVTAPAATDTAPDDSSTPLAVEDNTKTARCTSSMESDIAEELYGPKQAVNYNGIYDGSVDPALHNVDIFKEMRYWVVLLLFIIIVLIYRAFLPPIQCEAKFKQETT